MPLFSPKFNPSKDLVDLTGKVVIVTGANSGIGFGTVRHLARKGANVYLGARTESKAKAAIEKLNKDGVMPGEVIWLPCDLGTPQGAQKAAEEFKRMEKRLDVLVNNAAHTSPMVDPPGTLEEDAIPNSMMVNHIGTFVFTMTLLPLLSKTAELPGSDVRIVTVASDYHRMGRAMDAKLTFNSIDDFKRKYKEDRMDNFSRYVVSKLANILFATHLQHILTLSGISKIISLSVHPGTVNTFSDSIPIPLPASTKHFLVGLVTKDIDEGSWNSCFACASPQVRAKESEYKYKGAYLTPVGKVTMPSDNARRKELEEGLWRVTEEFLKQEGIEIPAIDGDEN